jgi:hypothetical protein
MLGEVRIGVIDKHQLRATTSCGTNQVDYLLGSLNNCRMFTLISKTALIFLFSLLRISLW